MKRTLFVSLLVCLLVSLLGCAGFKEGVRGLLGVSTKVLEEGRKDAITKTVSYDYNTCYKMTLNALKTMGSYVYAKDITRHMIAVYRSNSDTTPVGVFFKETSANTTQIEVTSPSKFTKEEAAAKIFSAFGEKQQTPADQPENQEQASK